MFLFLDGPFDSYDLSSVLSESKSLTSYDASQDDIRQAAIDSGFRMDSSGWKTNRRSDTTKFKKDFDKLQDRMYKGILEYTKMRKSGDISFSRWATWVGHLLRESYKESFRLGILSSGADFSKAGMASFDEKWVKTASKHEMAYFNKLLDQIESGTQKGTIEDRLKAYSDTLQNVFYSGRIVGTPSNHLIDWAGPNDRRTCSGCHFLIENSPYTKATLPSTPRAGDTACLNFCRCRLIVREVDKELFFEVQKKHKSKSWYKTKLSNLKAGKTL